MNKIKIPTKRGKYKHHQIEIVDLKETTELENLLEGFLRGVEQISERISKSEDRSCEFI